MQYDFDMTEYNSHIIESPQTGPHKRLQETVEKHIRCEFKKPFQQHNIVAFEQIESLISSSNAESLILDSCCGTGVSTFTLAQQNPTALVIGIDQSISRLTRNNEFRSKLPENCHFFRANCEDLWRLFVQHKIIFDKHNILYPNPYPKTEHLKRRWHGHPAFPYLKDLSSEIELRSNWKLYLEEFALAWQLLTNKKLALTELKIETPLTLFEKKYQESGQKLWQLA